MVGRHAHEPGAKDRVGPGGIDLQIAPLRQARVGHGGESERQPLRPADPVALHGAHLLGPVGQMVEARQQVVGHVGDAEEPLRQFPPLHLRAGAPAAAVDHLLVGQHRVIDRIPVDHRRLAIRQPRRQHVEEKRLLVAIIGGFAGGDLARPVQRQAHQPQLRLHRGDVVAGPGAGVGAALHRRVLGRHPEGVPAHRVQHVEALRPLVARDHVAHGVVAHMAHVDAPRGVGKHLQHIVFRARGIMPRGEAAAILPHRAPCRLDGRGVVAGHGRGAPAIVADRPRLTRRGRRFQRGARRRQPLARSSRRSWRARTRIESSILRGVSSATGAAIQAPRSSSTSRNTATRSALGSSATSVT